ncbi:hypothetical protein TNCV_4822021 [Trichonephila clavipes]|nr:hypothetical protein TNCV_4822021 [Trichonephila clavipes]
MVSLRYNCKKSQPFVICVDHLSDVFFKECCDHKCKKDLNFVWKLLLDLKLRPPWQFFSSDKGRKLILVKPFAMGVQYMYQSQTHLLDNRPFNVLFRGDDQSCRKSGKRDSPMIHPAAGDIWDGCIYDTPVSKMFRIDQYVVTY